MDNRRRGVCCYGWPGWEVFVAEDATHEESQLSSAGMGQTVKFYSVSSSVRMHCLGTVG
jgi:hypothetical protein